MSHSAAIILRPIVTEKASIGQEALRAYSFEVANSASKVAIKAAIEQGFGVEVQSVRTQVVRGKWKRFGRFVGQQPNWKKAVVTLADGQTIPVVSGQ